jgi:hypothetical protein
MSHPGKSLYCAMHSSAACEEAHRVSIRIERHKDGKVQKHSVDLEEDESNLPNGAWVRFEYVRQGAL